MKTLAIALGVALLTGGVAGAQSQEILIMGGSDQDEFLGCLTCSEYDGNSVWNQHSRHGWQNRYGTWNRYGPHASKYSQTSACNQYTQNAPALVDRSGNYYGRLSVNRYAPGSVCAAGGAEQVCTALRVMCSDE